MMMMKEKRRTEETMMINRQMFDFVTSLPLTLSYVSQAGDGDDVDFPPA